MMVNRKAKIEVVVASGDVLYRLGIKTILSVVGLDVQLIETDEMSTLVQLLQNDENKLFIISQDVVKEQELLFKKVIDTASSQKRILFLGQAFDTAAEHITFISAVKEQKELAEHFQNFFIESGSADAQDEHVLSEREIEVLRHVALGLANKEIADRLFISTNTVITHRKNITEKLGIKTIPGLTVYAIMNKFIEPEEVTY